MTDRLVKALPMGPKVIERILRVFPTDRLDDRIEVDRFTAREVIAHLADYEQHVLDRIRVATLKSSPVVPSYDPDKMAEAHKYSSKDVFHEAEVFESRRGMTVEFLRGLSADDFNKTFSIEGGRTWTIADYILMLLTHDMEHVEQLTHYLATEVATIS
ncbi:MAG: DinB family protein [Fimbriimonadaceae bacterium]|nr:DinB family protein [Fimbriimonadaceae bacterium]